MSGPYDTNVQRTIVIITRNGAKILRVTFNVLRRRNNLKQFFNLLNFFKTIYTDPTNPTKNKTNSTLYLALCQSLNIEELLRKVTNAT